jgi:DNA-binding transcriptional LysR family regulator
MDVRQLRVLLAVAETGSFSAAADELHTVQSNVSAHIARLERELRATLVDRSTGKLTDEWEAVARRARRVTAELDAIVTDLAALRHVVVGTVRIGMIATTARWLLPRLLELTAERHPGLRLVAVEGTSATLEPQLAAGRLDLAVVMLPVGGAELSFTPLFDEDLVLVVAADDPLAARASVTMAELADLELLLPLAGTPFRDEIDAAARPAGVTLRAKAELDGTRLIASLTFDGHGPAILPATAVPGYLRDRWRLVTVEGMPRRRVGVVQRARALPSAPVRAVLELLAELTNDPASRADGLHPPTPLGAARAS